MAHHLEELNANLFALTETWLDPDYCNYADFSTYELVSRRDRPEHQPSLVNHKGIIVYQKANGIPITHLENSPAGNRAWHTIHRQVGPIFSWCEVSSAHG